VIHSGDQPDFDLDEDLFDFAGVARAPDVEAPLEDIEEIFASFRDAPPAEELLAVPSAPGAPPVVRAHVPEPPAVAPSIAREARTQPSPPADSEEPVREVVPAARSARFSRGVLGIALSVTVLNSVLAVVMMRGRPEDELQRPDRSLEVEHEPLALAAPPHPKTADLPDPEEVGPVHSHPALDEARAEISRGEYASARQRVYGLLAIIDRLPDPRRGALEADCQFLIAQSLHLEALARMGGPQ